MTEKNKDNLITLILGTNTKSDIFSGNSLNFIKSLVLVAVENIWLRHIVLQCVALLCDKQF